MNTNWTAIRELAEDLELLATDVARSSSDHGPRHWRDVARMGLALWAEGVDISDDDLTIVLLFAMLHDTQRHNEFEDPEHGERAAALASRLGNSGRILDWLEGDAFVRLTQALRDHDKGEVMDPDHDVAIAVCWDADRLTLWRVGTEPDPAFLSTEQAREPLARASSANIVHGKDKTWEQIIAAYADVKPLDLLVPLAPPQSFATYRRARVAFGNNLHPSLEVDEDGVMPVVRNRFVQDMYFGAISHGYLNVRYLSVRAAADEAWEANDFERYILLHNKAYRLDAIHEVADFVTGERLAKLVGDHWVHSENIWQQQDEWAALWIEARDKGHLEHAMDEDGRQALDALPSTVKVYRGFNRPGRDAGLSWTVNQEQAEWFARRFGNDEFGPHVAEGTAQRESILAHFNARSEDEVVVLPEDVTIERIYEVD